MIPDEPNQLVTVTVFGVCVSQRMKSWGLTLSFEQINKKGPWLFRVYIGDYTTQLWGVIRNHHKDPYETASISWNVISFFCGSLGKFANNKNQGAVKILSHRLIGDNKIHSFLCELFLFQQYHTILVISPSILLSKGSKAGNEIIIQFLIH